MTTSSNSAKNATNTLIKKAIIPTAGLGIRFLPATKTVPKEMLTIVDAPIILYVVEEAVAAGIEDIVLIAGRGKHAIEDFFDTTFELEDRLHKEGKLHLLDRVIKVREKANIISIRQKQALGLGHAVLCGEPIVGNEPFAVLLGDEITLAESGSPSALQQLVEIYNAHKKSCMTVMSVQDHEVSKYGIVEVESASNSEMKVTQLFEKPQAHETKSRWGITGRYIFESSIFDDLKQVQPGVNGEIQLTDAMKMLNRRNPLLAQPLTATRFDAGDKLGYLIANIEIALRDPHLSADLQKYLQQRIK